MILLGFWSFLVSGQSFWLSASHRVVAGGYGVGNDMIILSLLWSDQIPKNVRKPPGRSPGIAGEANNYCGTVLTARAKSSLKLKISRFGGWQIMNFHQIPWYPLYIDTLITVKGQQFLMIFMIFRFWLNIRQQMNGIMEGYEVATM